MERSPGHHLTLLRDLLDIRAILGAAQCEAPASLQAAITGMTPVLRLLQHGDGGLALFNHSNEGDSLQIDLTLQRCISRQRPLMTAPETGFQRLQSGRTLVLVDAGPPPPPGYDDNAHAGTLSFEFSVGRDRLIVNCGAQTARPDWYDVQRTTAAHSTLTLAETNSSELSPGLGFGPAHCRGHLPAQRARRRPAPGDEPRRLPGPLRRHPPSLPLSQCRRR